MSENELTKDAEYMLCALYKSYLNRRKNGVNKHDAKMFGSSENIHKDFMSEWIFQDVRSQLVENSHVLNIYITNMLTILLIS